MYWNGQEYTPKNKKEKDALYQAQETADFYCYSQFINEKQPNTTVTKAPQYSPYDALQNNEIWIELKARHRYSIEDFDTFDLSLYKIDKLRTYTYSNNEKPKHIYVAALWTQDNKITLHPITEYVTNDAKYDKLINSDRLIKKWTSKKATDNNNKKFENTLITFDLKDKSQTLVYNYDLSNYWQLCEEAYNINMQNCT